MSHIRYPQVIERMEELGLSQRELADRLRRTPLADAVNLSQSYVSKVLHGRAPIRLEHIPSWCVALEVERAADLFPEIGDHAIRRTSNNM